MSKNKKNIFKKLTGRIVANVVLAVIISFAFFGMVYYFGMDIMDLHFLASDYVQNMEEPYVEDLQKYVTKNSLSTNDSDMLNKWVSENNVSYFFISFENNIIYAVTYANEFMLSGNASDDINEVWMYLKPVEFEDMAADVFIFADFTEKFYTYFIIIDALLSILLGILIVFLRSNKIIKRLSIDLQISKEAESLARKEKDMLIQSMAHDLRTPLTGLIAYTDILQIDNEKGVIPDEHIDTIRKKSIEVKELTDQLFDFSLASHETKIELDEPITFELALIDYLSEMAHILSDHGFEIDASELEWREIDVAVNCTYLGRVFNNIISNITKYADNKMPVILKTIYTKSHVGISISNTVISGNKILNSTGIGTQNIKMIMERMGGKSEFIQNSDTNQYTIRLLFNGEPPNEI